MFRASYAESGPDFGSSGQGGDHPAISSQDSYAAWASDWSYANEKPRESDRIEAHLAYRQEDSAEIRVSDNEACPTTRLRIRSSDLSSPDSKLGRKALRSELLTIGTRVD